MNFQDPKLILARAITLLYRENCLETSSQDNSVELVRNVMREVYVQEHSIGLDIDKAIVMGLKNFTLQLCDSFKDPYDKMDLLQQIRIITEEGDPKLFEALRGAIDIEFSQSSLKKSVVATRKQLDNYFREKSIIEQFKKASADMVYHRDQISNLSDYVQSVITNIEPLLMSSKTNDPAIMGSLNFGDPENVREVFQAAHVAATENNNVYVTLDNGFNEMTNGGLRPQASMVYALKHNYKTGNALSKFSQVLRANKPKTKDKNKIPCMVWFSFEDELVDISKFLFLQAKFSETREFVDLKQFSPEEMSEYVTGLFEKNGWKVFIERVDPTLWSYRDLFNYIIQLEAQGYSIEGIWLDYMALIPTTGCIQGAQGEALRDLLRRCKNFAQARGAIFHTPHQLSTTAEKLLQGTCTDAQFVHEVAGRAYGAGSGQLGHENDLEYVHHKVPHGKKDYLMYKWGKHRGQVVKRGHETYVREFPDNGMPIPDEHPDDPIVRRIGSVARVNQEEDLTNY